jgi:hypothetical protein
MGGRSYARGAKRTRDDRWLESIAVGSEQFVEQVKTELGRAMARRQIVAENNTHFLREPSEPYRHLFLDYENYH